MISIVINVDTREPKLTADGMLSGSTHPDYQTDGVLNKQEFFKGHDQETILFIDNHQLTTVPAYWGNSSTTVCVSQHREYYRDHPYFPKHNDMNYLQALSLARGKYIVHFDGDSAAFLNDPNVIKEWIEIIETGRANFICYPSHWSPVAINDPAYNDYMWASTRFFFCKRSLLDLEEIYRCLDSDEYLYGKYGEKNRRNGWLEHVLGIVYGKVYYPPMQNDRYMIFSWSQYISGLLGKLNTLPYEYVKRYVEQCGGIHYPNDLRAT